MAKRLTEIRLTEIRLTVLMFLLIADLKFQIISARNEFNSYNDGELTYDNEHEIRSESLTLILSELCDTTINLYDKNASYVRITLTKNFEPYERPLKCRVTFVTQSHGFVIAFAKLDIPKLTNKCKDNVQLFEINRESNVTEISELLCGFGSYNQYNTHHVYFSRSELMINFVSYNWSNKNHGLDLFDHYGFILYLTSYYKSDEIECERSKYFKCSNGKCVNKILHCNGINNCGDASDEIKCDYQNDADDTQMSPLGYLFICIGTILLLIIIIVIIKSGPKSARERARMRALYLCRPSHHHRRNRIHEMSIYSITNPESPPNYMNVMGLNNRPPSYEDAMKMMR